MKVNLISKTENAIRVAFTAIRTCYSPKDAAQLWNNEFDKYQKNNNDHIRLIKQIVNHGHTSTLEHINFTFSIEGVSRSLLAQLTRHRIGWSYSVQSQRYVNAAKNEFDYVTPDSFIDKEMQYFLKSEMERIQKVYNKLINNGIKPEDARYILPNAVTTNLIITCNLRAFMDFHSKRNKTTHAQWEIAELAEQMKNQIEESEEWTKYLFEDAAQDRADKNNEPFNIKSLFKTKFIKISPNSEVTKESVWKDNNYIYTIERDGSFNAYNWTGFSRTLTHNEMKDVIENHLKGEK